MKPEDIDKINELQAEISRLIEENDGYRASNYESLQGITTILVNFPSGNELEKLSNSSSPEDIGQVYEPIRNIEGKCRNLRRELKKDHTSQETQRKANTLVEHCFKISCELEEKYNAAKHKK